MTGPSNYSGNQPDALNNTKATYLQTSTCVHTFMLTLLNRSNLDADIHMLTKRHRCLHVHVPQKQATPAAPAKIFDLPGFAHPSNVTNTHQVCTHWGLSSYVVALFLQSSPCPSPHMDAPSTALYVSPRLCAMWCLRGLWAPEEGRSLLAARYEAQPCHVPGRCVE